MRHVPSQWSGTALWADFRVLGAVILFCVFLLGFLWLLSAGVSAGLSTVLTPLVRIAKGTLRR